METDNIKDVGKYKKIMQKSNPLLILMLVTVTLLQMYGFWITERGYENLMVQGYGEKVALAVLSIRDGYFPWGNKNDMAYIPAAGSVIHSSGLTAAGFAAASDQWGLKEIAENIYNMRNGRFTGVYVAEHMMRHSLMEEMLENDYWETVPVDGIGVQRIPVIGAVDESYFDDAVFIGDSRMMGVYEYAGMEGADYLAKVSMTIYSLLTTKITINGHNDTVRDILSENRYGKIYIMVGINELGTADTEYFINAYQAVLREIRKLQPDAVIIIQGIMHVTGKKNRTDRIFNNANINERNEALKELANGRDIFYIDVNEVYDDENGNLRQDMSADDVHLLANCYGLWHTFFLENGIVFEEQPAAE